MSDLHTLGVAQLSALLQKKDISAVELATHMLDGLDGNRYNAFLSVDSEVTLAQAKEADRRLAAGDTSPLLGVPIAHTATASRTRLTACPKKVTMTAGWTRLTRPPK
jgi:Asp-tRNA(Asn)/Glu-tRNA(Gln) amidotransferase A subunit family amidase